MVVHALDGFKYDPVERGLLQAHYVGIAVYDIVEYGLGVSSGALSAAKLCTLYDNTFNAPGGTSRGTLSGQ